jgi:hypothetical protein
MKFEGAVIKEQGVTFAIVIVKPGILDSGTQREETRQGFGRYFPGMPVILMAQNSQGVPTYFGKPDIVNYLAKIHPGRIPWKTYTIN